MPVETYRRRLWEYALDRYGYVTTEDAAALDIPPVELAKLARRGTMENIARGVYRFPDLPRTSRGMFMEAVLWVGRDSALSHDAVLALHELAFVNPRTVRVVTPYRVRKTHLRADITIVRDRVPPNDLTTYFAIPSTTVARALTDCRDMVMPERLREATVEARRRGLLLNDEFQSVMERLEEAS